MDMYDKMRIRLTLKNASYEELQWAIHHAQDLASKLTPANQAPSNNEGALKTLINIVTEKLEDDNRDDYDQGYLSAIWDLIGDGKWEKTGCEDCLFSSAIEQQSYYDGMETTFYCDIGSCWSKTVYESNREADIMNLETYDIDRILFYMNKQRSDWDEKDEELANKLADEHQNRVLPSDNNEVEECSECHNMPYIKILQKKDGETDCDLSGVAHPCPKCRPDENKKWWDEWGFYYVHWGRGE